MGIFFSDAVINVVFFCISLSNTSFLAWNIVDFFVLIFISLTSLNLLVLTEERTLLNSFYGASINLLPKQDKDATRKKVLDQYPQWT